MNIRPETIRSISMERQRQISAGKPSRKPLGEWILLLLAYANKAMWSFTCFGMGKTPEERITQCAALSVAAMDEHFGSHTPLDEAWYDWQSGLFGVKSDGSLMYDDNTVIHCEGIEIKNAVRAQCGDDGYVEFCPTPAVMDPDTGGVRTAVIFGRTTVTKSAPTPIPVNPRSTLTAYVPYAKLTKFGFGKSGKTNLTSFEIHLESSGEFDTEFFNGKLADSAVRVTVEVLS